MIKTVVLVCICVLAQAIYLNKDVEAAEQFCIGEDLPRHTLVKVDIIVKGHFDFDFKQGRMIAFRQRVDSNFSRSFTTQRYGMHFFCLTNKGKEQQRVRLQIAAGKQANDYGSAVDSEDLLGSLSNQGRVALSFIQDIVSENSEGMEIMVSESSDHYSFSNLYIFSGAFVVASIVLTCLQYRVIRKYLHARKYI